MNSKKNKENTIWQSYWKKLWVRLLIIFTLLIVVILLILPYAVKISLEKWLLNNGADQAAIGKIELNLFTGEASIKEVDIARGGKTVLANSIIYMNMNYGALFQRKAFITTARLENVLLDIERMPDGRWRFGSVNSSEKTSPQLTEEADHPWYFATDKLEITNSTIRYNQPGLQANFHIDNGLLEKFSTAPDELTERLSLQGTLNGAPIDLEFTTLQTAPTVKITGTIAASGLQIQDIEDLVSENIKSLTGGIVLNGGILFEVPDEETIIAGYKGSIEFNTPQIVSQDFSVAGEKTIWNGEFNFHQEHNKENIIELNGSITGDGLKINLPGQNINLQEDKLEIQGKTSISLYPAIAINSENTISFGYTDFAMPEYKFHGSKITWSGSALFDAGNQNTRMNGTLTLVEPLFDSKKNDLVFNLTGGELNWQGQTEYLMRSQKSTLYLKGSFDGKSLSAILPGSDLRFSQNTLRLTGDLTVPMENSLQLQGNAELAAQGSLLVANGTGQKLLMLEKLSINDMQSSGEGKMSVGSILANQFWYILPTQENIQLSIPEMQITQLTTNDQKSFSLQELSLLGIKLENTVDEQLIGSLGAISGENIAIDSDFNLNSALVSLNDAQLYGMESSGKTENLLSVAAMQITQPNIIGKNNLHIDKINIEELQANIIRDENGRMNFTPTIQLFQGESGVQETENNSDLPEKNREEPGFVFKINEILTQGKSGIHFEDETLEIPFNTDLTIEKLSIQGIDSTDKQIPATYELAGSLGNKEIPLAIKGTFFPTVENFSLQQTMSLKNYPMVRLAPYSIEYLGITPTQGTLNVDSELSFQGNTLDLQKHWLLKKLEIKSVDSERADHFNSQLPMSLDAALSLLKDKHDNIDLSMSISGPINDLDFGLSGLFIEPLSKAIVSASSSYLLYALGPYGAAAFVGLKVGEMLMETRLPALEFQAGQGTLTEEHKKYLKRIADILINRPQLDLQICPFVMPGELRQQPVQETSIPEQQKKTVTTDNQTNKQDQPYQPTEEEKKAVLQLGNDRADAIKRYLIQAHDIEPDRLLLCMPEFDNAKDAVPRVELEI